MSSNATPAGPPPNTAETPSTTTDESEWTPLFDALCAEFGHPAGTPA